MCRKDKMININKLVIFLLSITGLIIDGNIADGFYAIALILWLWEPDVIELEISVSDIFSKEGKK